MPPIEQRNKVLINCFQIQYPDGTRPKEVVWSCPSGQVCCGTDCCPAQQFGNPNSANSRGAGQNGGGWNIGGVIFL